MWSWVFSSFDLLFIDDCKLVHPDTTKSSGNVLLHSTLKMHRAGFCCFPPPSPPAVGKCVSGTDPVHMGWQAPAPEWWRSQPIPRSSRRLAASGEAESILRKAGCASFAGVSFAHWVLRRMLTDRSYIIKRRGRAGERAREGGGGEIFPLHACSCPHQLEHFQQLFTKRQESVH